MNINPKLDQPEVVTNGSTIIPTKDDYMDLSEYEDTSKPANGGDRLYQEVNYQNTDELAIKDLRSDDFYSEAVDVIRSKQLNDRISNVYAEPHLNLK
jgi:hypothetical protein